VCYVLQALAVMRAQFTDRHVLINWIATLLLTILASAYGSFRFRKGGNLNKIYECMLLVIVESLLGVVV
jgi:hypothetical protein